MRRTVTSQPTDQTLPSIHIHQSVEVPESLVLLAAMVDQVEVVDMVQHTLVVLEQAARGIMVEMEMLPQQVVVEVRRELEEMESEPREVMADQELIHQLQVRWLAIAGVVLALAAERKARQPTVVVGRETLVGRELPALLTRAAAAAHFTTPILRAEVVQAAVV